ncbi:hypothetical protein ACTI_85000 [Actinoplanes sp. OR16]|uniref:Rv0361 family membrane protein n=1 Tax=Actinoplanes sp. OR16 TaxID=946334 RepID=UPI000F6FF418|nr:hypothetical protein [Actinoplanes sp. OR16]BBH71815.1 hypothetical protein ACTI_85000 [Actinoplanes sp. OR16]
MSALARIAGVASVLAAGVIGTGGYLLLREDHGGRGADTDEIRNTVEEFVLAVDRDDRQVIRGLVCARELTAMRDVDGRDETDPGGFDLTISLSPVTISDTVVAGDEARATISRPAVSDPVTLVFRKEKGLWKVCDPAAGHRKK